MKTKTYYIDKKIFWLQYIILLILLILLVSITITDAISNGSTWSLAHLTIGVIGIFGCAYFSQKNAKKLDKPTLVLAPEGLQFPYEINEAHIIQWSDIAYIDLKPWSAFMTIYFKPNAFQNYPSLQRYFKSLSLVIPRSRINQPELIELENYLNHYINHSNDQLIALKEYLNEHSDSADKTQIKAHLSKYLNNIADDDQTDALSVTQTNIQYKNIVINHDIFLIFMGALILNMILIATGFSGTALILTFMLFVFCWLIKIKVLKDQTACIVSDNNLQVNFYGSMRTIDWHDIESIKIREVSRLFSQSSIIEIHLHGQKNSFTNLTWWKKIMMKRDLKRGIPPIHVNHQLKDYAIDDLLTTLQTKLAQKI